MFTPLICSEHILLLSLAAWLFTHLNSWSWITCHKITLFRKITIDQDPAKCAYSDVLRHTGCGCSAMEKLRRLESCLEPTMDQPAFSDWRTKLPSYSWQAESFQPRRLTEYLKFELTSVISENGTSSLYPPTNVGFSRARTEVWGRCLPNDVSNTLLLSLLNLPFTQRWEKSMNAAATATQHLRESRDHIYIQANCNIWGRPVLASVGRLRDYQCNGFPKS